MKKFLPLWIISYLLVALPVAAQPPSFSSANLSTPGTSKTLVLPSLADASPVISLGSGIDPQTGKVVQGFAFIHYKNAPSHKPQHNPGGNPATTSPCFAYLAKGAKWKTIEPWVMNPANIEGLDPALLLGLEDASLAKWEDAADGVVNGAGVEIFGAGASTSTILVVDTSSPDGQNEVYFGDVGNVGAIAVTIVWGIFAGPPSGRELVEWDQIYDQVDFDWSAGAAGVAGKMDFDNIATHENGHSGGMAHPPDDCTEETMYRFSATAETKKRDLNTGDINGINGLY